jgi:UDPglucose 6-dehydrogenase
MQSYGILGYGVVGKATHKSILWDKNVVVHDIAQKTDIKEMKKCKTVFVCLPADNQSEVDKLVTEIVEVKKTNQWCDFVLRSTVPIGTCDKIQKILQQSIYYMPEFLRDRYWETDCLNRPIILGSDMQTVPDYLQNEDVLTCTLQEAETLKMMSNAYASLRITFANHFYDLSKKLGCDYNHVVEMLMQTQHDQTYLEANENLRGFGGKCLTKDLEFLLATFRGHNLEEKLLSAIKEDNQKWPTTVRES